MGCIGDYVGEYYWGDARSLDYGSYEELLRPKLHNALTLRISFKGHDRVRVDLLGV